MGMDLLLADMPFRRAVGELIILLPKARMMTALLLGTNTSRSCLGSLQIYCNFFLKKNTPPLFLAMDKCLPAWDLCKEEGVCYFVYSPVTHSLVFSSASYFHSCVCSLWVRRFCGSAAFGFLQLPQSCCFPCSTSSHWCPCIYFLSSGNFLKSLVCWWVSFYSLVVIGLYLSVVLPSFF